MNFYIEDYGCINKLQFNPSPLHALIGPSGAGKSTILRAILEKCQRDGVSAELFEFNAQSLCDCTYPLVDGTFLPNGDGLANVYYNASCSGSLEDTYKEIYRVLPYLQEIQVYNQNGYGSFCFLYKNGAHGGIGTAPSTLRFLLAYHALKWTKHQVILIENPENSIHPCLACEEIKILRELSANKQVIFITYSPLVMNELEGHEVSVIVPDKFGCAKAILMKDVPGFDDAMKIYSLGEFWVSFADGIREAPLLSGGQRS